MYIDCKIKNGKHRMLWEQPTQSAFHRHGTRPRRKPWTCLPLSTVGQNCTHPSPKQHAYCFVNKQGTCPCTQADPPHTTRLWWFIEWPIAIPSSVTRKQSLLCRYDRIRRSRVILKIADTQVQHFLKFLWLIIIQAGCPGKSKISMEIPSVPK